MKARIVLKVSSKTPLDINKQNIDLTNLTKAQYFEFTTNNEKVINFFIAMLQNHQILNTIIVEIDD